MKPFLKRFSIFLFVILVGLAAGWMVHPGGSKINLKPLGIDYEKSFDIKLGLDLKGGAHLVYQADFSEISDEN
ncbi:MAG TPA: hypothetical protein PKD34_00970, partial [Candidatus Doudnabacteria bacterium]|nr:hypothetical protein [Candidatus Doudnabacteria bacterium]